MLHPKNNRMDYGQLLTPPDGYALTKAVGTTYSLDLEALMIMPVAMFYSQSFDRPKNEIRVDIIDALVKAADKISIYYQEGKLKVPDKYHHLMAYWEKGIHKVRMPHFASSFHPKVWIIRFDAVDLNPIYRVIVTSRNLTFASNYDVAFSTEGESIETEKNKNEELVDFLKYLNSASNNIADDFIQGLQKTTFDIPEKFDELIFHPIGIDPRYPNPIHKFDWEELLVISPFVDDKTVQQLKTKTGKSIYLMSRQDELTVLKPKTLDGIEPWQFSNFIEQSAANEEVNESNEEPLPNSLHAKMYVGMWDNEPYWYLGSANCTAPANDRNIEFLIELRASGRSMKPSDVHYMLTDTTDKSCVQLFEPFIPCDGTEIEKEKKLELQLRTILYNLFNCTATGFVTKEETTGLYNQTLEIDLENFSAPADFTIFLQPISRENEIPVMLIPGEKQEINSFKGYPETLLTPYFKIFIKHQKRVESQSIWCVQMELPPSRLNKIFTSIIDSSERFMQYLFFLLNGTEAERMEGSSPKKMNRGADSELSNLFYGKPVFESLLIEASRDARKLKSINEILIKLQAEDESKAEDEKIVPKAFLIFWDVFKNFIQPANVNE